MYISRKWKIATITTIVFIGAMIIHHHFIGSKFENLRPEQKKYYNQTDDIAHAVGMDFRKVDSGRLSNCLEDDSALCYLVTDTIKYFDNFRKDSIAYRMVINTHPTKAVMLWYSSKRQFTDSTDTGMHFVMPHTYIVLSSYFNFEDKLREFNMRGFFMDSSINDEDMPEKNNTPSLNAQDSAAVRRI